jgi:hypothetical protein
MVEVSRETLEMIAMKVRQVEVTSRRTVLHAAWLAQKIKELLADGD